MNHSLIIYLFGETIAIEILSLLKKVAGWADKINSGERVVIKHPRLGEKFKQE
ncbi:DUF1889 family protein [Xenorhabdus beddingii]|nr:DUF1889 family protein [Xenorhabdus beddingii]